MSVSPAGTGVLFNTNFLFEAAGTFPPATEFTWRFGDGQTATTTTASASHVYAQTGSFSVSVEARAGASSQASTAQVSVRSLAGRWLGTVTGHTQVPPARPVVIRQFELTVNSVPAPSGRDDYVSLPAFWADDAGCRRDRLILQIFSPRNTAHVDFSIESLPCNDGDFFMRGMADARFDRVEGTCSGGPNCRFQMARQ